MHQSLRSTYRWYFAYYLPTSSCQRSFWMTPNQYSKLLWMGPLWIPFLYYCTSQSFYVAKIQCWHLWPSSAMKVEWKLLIFKGFLIRNFNTFMIWLLVSWPYRCLKSLKINISIFLAKFKYFMLRSLKALPYQFDLAAILGFWDQ